jgi:hypothetical protein
MPTIADIYRTLKEHEELEKSASQKKTAIANPAGGPGASVSDAIENVLGPNIAETKVRIKKKLEEVAGQQKAVEGLGSNREDEHPASTQTPQAGDQMPPGGSAKAAAASAKAEEKKAEPKVEPAAEKSAKDMPAAFKKYLDEKRASKKKADDEKPAEEDAEKVAAEKIAAEYYAAGQIMAQGFAHELNRLMGGDEEK